MDILYLGNLHVFAHKHGVVLKTVSHQLLIDKCLIISIPASSYEIRCHTSRSSLLDPATFREQGILVHSSFTPDPLERGRSQSCSVGVPWPDQTFYYALVAVDQAGNVGPVSNVVSLYVPSKRPSPTTSDPFSGIGVGGNVTAVSSLGGFGFVGSQRLRVYLAVAAGVGLVLLAVAVVVVILVRARVRRRKREVQYDSEDKDTYRTYEPRPPPAGKAAAASDSEGAVNAPSGGGKNLSSWLDSLPRSEAAVSAAGASPNTTSHDLSLENGGTLGRGQRGNHTLTKTNPYRHKVLTNGSFLNLKDIPNGSGGGSGGGNASNNSNEDSSRPTTSTEDTNSGSSQSSESGEFHHHQQQQHQQQQQLHRQLHQRLHPTTRDDLSVSTLPLGSRQYHHQNGHSNNNNVIDTSTARAIIDTYSGNLFSSGYHNSSLRHNQHRPRDPLQSMTVEVGPSRLDCVDRSPSSYPHVVPEPFYHEQQQHFYVRQYEEAPGAEVIPPPVRPRTESVV